METVAMRILCLKSIVAQYFIYTNVDEWVPLTHMKLLPQTLEHAFLQLCETSDQVGSKQGSSPQGGVLESSQSFESGRDESRPILGIRPGPKEELPKYSGTALKDGSHVIL